MAKVYANKCKYDSEYNFNRVPKSMQSKVRVILEEDGYIINPDGTVVKGE